MRCYLKNNYSSGVSQIIVKKLPVSTKVLYVGDKFRVDEDTQEYTVTTGDVTSDSSGEATINFTPVLAATYASNTPVQIPAPRLLTATTRTKIAAESGTVMTYFLLFNLDEIYRITNIETYASGTKIKITSAGHGLDTSDPITLDLPLEYEGDYTITKLDNNSFTVDVAFDADAPTEGTYDVSAPVRITTEAHDVTWDSYTWTAVGGMLYFEAIMESSDIKQSGVEITLSGVDPTMLSLFLSKAFCARNAKVWCGYINSDGTITCDSDKDMLFSGKMLDDWRIRETRNDDNQQAGTIELTSRLESGLSITETATGLQTNVESHQQYYDGVLWFDQVGKLINKTVKWGKIEQPKSKGGLTAICLAFAALSQGPVPERLGRGAENPSYILRPIRWYSQTHLEKKTLEHYKEISPAVVAAVEAYPCKEYIYKQFIGHAREIATAIRKKNNTEAERMISQLLSDMEKFIA